MKFKKAIVCMCSLFIFSTPVMAVTLEHGSIPDGKYVVISSSQIESSVGNKVSIKEILEKKKKTVAEEVYQALSKKDGKGPVVSGDLEGTTPNGGYYWKAPIDTKSMMSGSFAVRNGVKGNSNSYDIFIPIGKIEDGDDYEYVNQSYLGYTQSFVTAFKEAVAEGVLAGSVKAGYNIYEPYADNQLYVKSVMEEKDGSYVFTNTADVKYTLAYFYSPLFGKLPSGETPITTKDWKDKGYLRKVLDEVLNPNRESKMVEINIDGGYFDFIQGNAPECESVIETDKSKMLSAKGVEAYQMDSAKYEPSSAVNYLLRVAVPIKINEISPNIYGLSESDFMLIDNISLSITKNYVFLKSGTTNNTDDNIGGQVVAKSKYTSTKIDLYKEDFDDSTWSSYVLDLGTYNTSTDDNVISVSSSNMATSEWSRYSNKYIAIIDALTPNDGAENLPTSDIVKDGSFMDYNIDRGKLALYGLKQSNGTIVGVLIPLKYMEAIYDTGTDGGLYATGRMLEFVENYTKNLKFASPSTGMFNVIIPNGGTQGATVKYYAFKEDSTSFMDKAQHTDIGDKPSSSKIHVTFSSDKEKGRGFMLVRNNLFLQDNSLIHWLQSSEADKLRYVKAEHLLNKITGKYELGEDVISFKDWVRVQEIKDELANRNEGSLIRIINIITITFGIVLAIYGWLLPLAYWLDIFNTFFDEFSVLQLMTRGRMYPVTNKEEKEYLLRSSSSGVRYVYIHDVFIMTLICCSIALLFIFGQPILRFLVNVWLFVQHILGGY